MARTVTLYSSTRLTVLDNRCQHPRAAPTGERGGEPAHLVLLRRGAFSYVLGRKVYLGEPCTGLWHRGAHSYRVGHPGDEGDDATVVVVSPGLEDEVFAGRPPAQPELPLDARAQLLHARTWRALQSSTHEPLELEERVLELLEAVSRPPALKRRLGGGLERSVTRARELVAANLSANLDLGVIAAEAQCSPFHLMRAFRSVTGRSLRAYRRELRVAEVLSRLAEGEGDLARLAAEVGFTHHSHLSQSFRQVLGMTPTGARRELGALQR